MLISPGDQVIVDSPTYSGAIAAVSLLSRQICLECAWKFMSSICRLGLIFVGLEYPTKG